MSESAFRYLHEASLTGSMRAAGDKMGIAVSSISRQIAQLEREMGTSLIEHGRRVIRLTEAGELAVNYYRNQLAERDAFFAQVADLRSAITGRVDLAIGEGFLGQTIASVIEDFRTRHPQVRLGVHIDSTAEIVRRVVEDEVHLGLVLQLPSEPKIRLRTSLAQALMAVVAPSHPLARFTSIRLDELQAHELCLAPKEFRVRQILENAGVRKHIFLNEAMTTNSVSMMRQVAKTGKFATVLPLLAAIDELRDGSLVGIPLIDERLEETTVCLVSRTGRKLEGAPLRLLNAIEARMKSWIEASSPAR
jgi:DNA-binding transcriptional LysR family regulator